MTNHTESTYLERLSAGDPQYRQLNGDGYAAGAVFEPAGNNTKELYIENTSSDTYFGAFFGVVRASEGVLFQTGYNVTESTVGDGATIVSRRTDVDSDDSTAIARTGGDGETGVYTAGTLTANRVGGAGGKPTTVQPATLTDEATNVIAPGDNILVRAENFSGNPSKISIETIWAEIPAGEMP